MTFTSEELEKAAYESIWNYQTITEKEQEVAREFFYRGALWAVSKMEESRQCKMVHFLRENTDIFKCGNCENYNDFGDKFCWNCGCKFIKGE